MVTYPETPGVRSNAAGETSGAAAEFIAPFATGMCADVLALLKQAPATPEELTDMLQRRSTKRVLLTTVRARVCQLRAQGLVVDEGSRGIGESGKVRVIRWRPATPAETVAFLATKEAARG